MDDPYASALSHEYSFRVREHHLDYFGHVNHAAYFQIAEEARWEMISARGYGLDVVEELRLGPVILEAKIRYNRELTNREEVRILTKVTGYDGPIGSLLQQFFKGDGRVACSLQLKIGLWHLDERKLRLPTSRWAEVLRLPDVDDWKE